VRAAAIAAGLAERKRRSSLRAHRRALSTLRGVVALEGAVPLLTVAVAAIGTGLRRRRHSNATEAQNRPMVAPAWRTTC